MCEFTGWLYEKEGKFYLQGEWVCGVRKGNFICYKEEESESHILSSVYVFVYE